MVAAVACQPIPGTLPRGLRTPSLIQVESTSTAPPSVRLRSPSTGWQPGRAFSTSLPEGTLADHDLVAFDIDANGSVELVDIASQGGATTLRAVQLQLPTGGLVVEQLTTLPSPGPDRLTAALDIDDDRRTDLVSLRITNTANGSVELTSVTAASGFQSGSVISLPIGVDDGWSDAAALDANGDCRSDLAVIRRSAPSRVVILDGAAGFTRALTDVRPDGGAALGSAAATTTVISPDDDLGGAPALWVLSTDGDTTTVRTLSAATAFAALSPPFPLPAGAATLVVAPSNPPLGGAVESIPVSGRNDQVAVGAGIVVHRCIAGPMRALLAEARAAGFAFTGAGWRSSAEQAVLRRRHCGARAATAPTEACRPPTAPVGTSMHERGLAVDFRLGGRTIGSRSSPAYRWLAANAARFGFSNYPPEPWHWSTNGE
jgi:hypothetical protein